MYESEEDLKGEYLFCGAAAAHGQERGGFLARGVCHGLNKLTGCDLDEALLRPPLRRESVRCGGGCVEPGRVQEGHLPVRGRDFGL